MKTRTFARLLPGLALLTPLAAYAQVISKNTTTKIMAVGDSITEGKFVGNGGYRQLLQNDLTAGGYSFDFVGKEDDGQPQNNTGFSQGMTDPNHEGYGSFRINEIDDGGSEEGHTAPPIDQTLTTYNPDAVLLMIGTNDILQGYDPGGPGENGQTGFAADAAARLDSLVSDIVTTDHHATLVLASVTPLSNSGQDANAQAYNAYIPGIVSKYDALGDNVVFTDMHSAVPTSALSDGVHPTAAGYKDMADTWYQALTGSAPTPSAPKPVQAGPAVSDTSASFQGNGQTFSLGYSFTTGGSAVTVTDLGYVNDGSNTTHDVGIYKDSNKSLVPGARATVTVGATRDATQFSYTKLGTAVTLAANTTYDIEGTDLGYGFFTNAQGFTTNSAITYGTSDYAVSSTLAPPTNDYPANNPGNFGPNFLIAASPEPSQFAAFGLGLLGLAGLGWKARRRETE